MIELDYDLLRNYFNHKIPYNELEFRIKEIYDSDKKCILHELKKAYNNKDSIKIDYLVYLLFVLENINIGFNFSEYLEILHKLLVSDWHNKHEDIVMLIEKISDCQSLEYLFHAIFLKPNYLVWDDNCSFEKKCIYALMKIGKEKSVSYLKQIGNNDNKIISDCAKRQLVEIEKQHNVGNEVRAVFTNDTIRVYQAYNRLIAEEAVRLGTFGKKFNMNRMTWIKPSFLWMMYRCGWADKENQECVLAIDIQREGFDQLMKKAVSTSYQEKIFGSQSYWQYQLKTSDVICQWDPERDVYGNPLAYRSIQLGLRGEILKKYVNEWIVSIEDITEYVLELKKMRDRKQDISEFLPKESVYLM